MKTIGAVANTSDTDSFQVSSWQYSTGTRQALGGHGKR